MGSDLKTGRFGNLLSKEQNTYLLLGNEAIARGAIEAGVGLSAAYPGTPSSEVGDVLSEISGPAGRYFEFSTNEKVALEVAAASAASGVRSFVFMKHVGMNVASDAMLSTAYVGTRAGLVIMTADDPSMFSSQNEQDNRHYSEMSRLPLVEPSNPQEAKDFLVYAFDLSERVASPVIFRTTTRVSHMRGLVRFGPIMETRTNGKFIKDPNRFVPLPANAYRLKKELVERFEVLRGIAEKSPLNKIEKFTEDGNSHNVGVITSGASYNSVMDVVSEYDLKVDVLKLGFSNPLPNDIVSSFGRNHSRVVVVEELDPFLEEKTRALFQLHGITTSVNGKMDGYFGYSHEYNPDRVAIALSKNLGFRLKEKLPPLELAEVPPPRPPVLCAGCPHRATFYAVELASKQLGLKDAIYPSDIGCYSLGGLKPFLEADYLLCMGSSVGTAGGFSKSTNQKVISFIGDSTFFHAGIPGLINAVHNDHKLVLVILDNRTTAMTGNQPNPGVPLNGMNQTAQQISIEEIVKAAGVKFVKTVDPYDERGTLQAVKDALKFDGVSVVIAQQECALLKDAELRRTGNPQLTYYEVNPDKCINCKNCVSNFSCPAFYLDIKDGSVKIDSTLCDGCGVCAEPLVCPPHAIEPRQRSV